jgi:hypothetical protein
MKYLILKYIIVENGAIIFPESIVHSAVAESFPKIYSAGFVKVTDLLEVTPFGESTSLKIKSNPIKDIIFLNDFFNPLPKSKYLGLTASQIY